MKFNPSETTKAASEEMTFQLLPDGDYDAEVLECEDTTSASGNPMFKLKLGIADPSGGNWKHHVYDYISPNFFQHKFHAFFESMGKTDIYETGDVDANLLVGQYVTATISTEPAKGDYTEKNRVDMYVLAEISAAKKMKPEILAKAAASDDLPF